MSGHISSATNDDGPCVQHTPSLSKVESEGRVFEAEASHLSVLWKRWLQQVGRPVEYRHHPLHSPLRIPTVLRREPGRPLQRLNAHVYESKDSRPCTVWEALEGTMETCSGRWRTRPQSESRYLWETPRLPSCELRVAKRTNRYRVSRRQVLFGKIQTCDYAFTRVAHASRNTFVSDTTPRGSLCVFGIRRRRRLDSREKSETRAFYFPKPREDTRPLVFETRTCNPELNSREE